MARPRVTDVLSINELRDLIDERKSKMQALRKERRDLAGQLARIEHELELLGPGTSGRPRNEKNLIDVIADVLGKVSEPMKVGEITQRVVSSGYRSSSANFKGIVNQTLLKDRRFASAGRGLYQLRK